MSFCTSPSPSRELMAALAIGIGIMAASVACSVDNAGLRGVATGGRGGSKTGIDASSHGGMDGAASPRGTGGSLDGGGTTLPPAGTSGTRAQGGAGGLASPDAPLVATG